MFGERVLMVEKDVGRMVIVLLNFVMLRVNVLVGLVFGVL